MPPVAVSPAFAALTAPSIDLARAHLPADVLHAVLPALLVPVAGWLERIEAAGAQAETLPALSLRLLELAAELPVAALAEALADSLTLAALLGRASVVAEAEEDGVSFAKLFGAAFADAGADPDLVFQGAPMAEAIDFLRQKVALPQADWRDLLREGHDRAFVVAGNLREDVAADIQASIIRAMETGSGLKGFRADFRRILDSDRWTGDPSLAVDQGRFAWRTRTIFNTNLRTSHAAGRLKQQRALKDVLPFWQYRHAATRTPKRPRLDHVRLDGLTLPADDPAWATIYAPNGWLCSCAIRAITARAADRMSPNKRIAPDDADLMAVVPDEWRYMPGDTWERGLAPERMPELASASSSTSSRLLSTVTWPGKIGRTPRAPSGDLTPLTDIAKPFERRTALTGQETGEELLGLFLGEFGAAVGRATLFRDVAGETVVVSDALFRERDKTLKLRKSGRHRHLVELALTLKDPDEIWVDWDELPNGQVRRVRRYLRYDPETAGFVSFAWSKDGWDGLTAFQQERGRKLKPSLSALEAQRHGLLLYRRPASQGGT